MKKIRHHNWGRLKKNWGGFPNFPCTFDGETDDSLLELGVAYFLTNPFAYPGWLHKTGSHPSFFYQPKVETKKTKYNVLVQKWDMDTSKFSTSLSSSPMNIWPFWCIFVIFETWLKEPTIRKLISFDHVPTFPKMFCSVWVLPCSNFSSSSAVLIHFLFGCN